MTNVTKSLLSEYYGFGADADSKKSLSSHEGTNSLEIILDQSSIQKPVGKDDENVAKEKNAAENADSNSDPQNASQKNPARSSRILDEDGLIEDETLENDYEIFLESKSIRNDYVFKKANFLKKSPSIENEKTPVKNNEDPADPNFVLIEEPFADNSSEVSSSIPRKRPGKKNKASLLTPLPPAPKKISTCNGVYLDLTNAGITVFPVNMLEKLAGLKMLYLENNNLAELPIELFPSLQHLHWLDVRNNQLTTIPTNITWHPCLETLLLQGNKIKKLPIELCLVPKLKGLQTLRNPLVFPPKEIVALGCAGIINFLRKEWEKLHPEESIKSQEDEIKPNSSTILSHRPKSILKKKNPTKIPASNSSSCLTQLPSKKTARDKSWGYKPSNRCESKGSNENTTMRLLWISKVKEMLGRQALALQRMKDGEMLKDWRKDRSSYVKSMRRAANRTEEDVPFAIDPFGIPLVSKQELKMHKSRKSKKGKPGIAPPMNINKKLQELFESLGQLQEARKSESLSPRTEQALLEIEIKKISDLQDEVQSLRRYNEIVVAPFQGPHCTPRQQYVKPPSIII